MSKKISCYVLAIILIGMLTGCTYHFSDENLEKEVLQQNPSFGDSFSEEELFLVETLNVGGYREYFTLLDICELKKIQKLYLSDSGVNEEDESKIEMKNTQLEVELKRIIDSSDYLEVFSLSDEKLRLNSFSFIENGVDNLKDVRIEYVKAEVYTDIFGLHYLESLTLKNIPELSDDDLLGIDNLDYCTFLDLSGTGVEKADFATGMDSLKVIVLEGTPLADNEEELQKLKSMNIEIR